MLVVGPTDTESPALGLAASRSGAPDPWLVSVEALPDNSDWAVQFRESPEAVWVNAAPALTVGLLPLNGSDAGAWRFTGSAAGAMIRVVATQFGLGGEPHVFAAA